MTSPTAGHAPGMADVNDAAQILGVDQSTVRRMVRLGRLQVKDRIGRAPLFYRCDVEALAGTIRRPPDPTNRCGRCDKRLPADPVEWNPANTRPRAVLADRPAMDFFAITVRLCHACGRGIDAAIDNAIEEEAA